MVKRPRYVQDRLSGWQRWQKGGGVEAGEWPGVTVEPGMEWLGPPVVARNGTTVTICDSLGQLL